MKKNRLFILFSLLITLSLVFSSMALAEEGISDSGIFRRNVSKTPDQDTERANLNHMSFYVPAQSQSQDGPIVEPVTYYKPDGTVYETRDYVKPLIAVYIDGMPVEEELYSILSGAGYGQHDAYAAHSLDDGATWKTTNLSLSADLSSFTLANGNPYPGDAHNMTFAIAGDKILVGWISKYCDGGSPLFTFPEDVSEAIQSEFGLPDLYIRDIWGVAGSQNSVDYELQGFPEVGEIPYSCVWSARGQLLLDAETNTYDVVWTKAERLTSGRRDANRLEMNGDSAAGFMMTWQEDPEGLRPGQGLGPGEGWSGAVVNQQTDLWYSFIAIDDFDKVDVDGIYTDTVDAESYTTLTEYVNTASDDTTMPKVAVPMAMPIRLTDNKMCKASASPSSGDSSENTGSNLYCYVNFDDDDPYGLTALPVDGWDDSSVEIEQSEDSTLCASTVSWTNPGGTTLELCQTEDGRILQGRVGASRPRVNVQPYNSLFIDDATDPNDPTNTKWYDSALIIMGAEESKALGEGSTDEAVEPIDIGKNMWYYSFDLLNPIFVQQGGMLNQPAQCSPYDQLEDDCTLGEFMLVNEADDYDLEADVYAGADFYETEITRRFSHMSQPIHQIGPSGVSSVLIVKQGIINQGGPADIFLRRTQVGDDVEQTLCDHDGNPETEYVLCLPEGYNPYAYENMVCENLDGSSGWDYLPDVEEDPRDGTINPNPHYVQGLCKSNMINVSGTSIAACDDGSVTTGDCADAFPWDNVVDGDKYPKVTEWFQVGPDYGVEITEDNIGNLDDQSWENPYDVAKGHRGFIDGDFIMMMYAWSPNWKANSVGNDHYNLYARRSFDGGKTWTTLPQAFLDSIDLGDWTVLADGTETCENYCVGVSSDDCSPSCTTYAPGDFEQARNLSQLIGNKITVLDPRYTPTGGLKMLPISDLKGTGFTGYWDDVRNPSKYFIVYETGDNTTVAEGEAVPLDLFYSRATNFGDDYYLVEYPTGEEDPEDPTLGFDWLEHDQDDLSGEAANTCNNGGTFYYAIWNQWQEDEYENISESDAIFRRIWFEDNEEGIPAASYIVGEILYVSTIQVQDMTESITFIGTTRGEDAVEYQWSSNLNGVLSTEKSFVIPASSLQIGRHEISFQAESTSGKMSNPVTIFLDVGYTIHIPAINH